ncbi:hypothetical protein ACLOJK_011596 [Asimina triloba]
MPPWMALFLAALVGFFPFLYLLSLIRSKGTPNSTKTHASLPPGPKGIPVLGSLLTLGSLPHRTLHKLAQQYGPIMYLRLGLVPTIVVSSPDAAQQFLKTHDLVFASRADTELGRFVSHGQKGVGFTQYGSYWRNMRKFYTMELLSSHRVEFFQYLRREELGLLLQSLKAAAAARSPTNLTWAVSSLATDITSRMVFGKKFVDVHSDKKSFKEAVTELVSLSGAFNIADYIPILGPLDLQGYRRRMKANSRFFETILDKIIDDHLRSSDSSRQRDFVDFMLEFMTSSDNQFQFDRTNIRVLMLVSV